MSQFQQTLPETSGQTPFEQTRSEVVNGNLNYSEPNQFEAVVGQPVATPAPTTASISIPLDFPPPAVPFGKLYWVQQEAANAGQSPTPAEVLRGKGHGGIVPAAHGSVVVSGSPVVLNRTGLDPDAEVGLYVVWTDSDDFNRVSPVVPVVFRTLPTP